MRGQEYTVMNYIVWAAFAAAFLVAVFAAYKSIVSQGCEVSQDQMRRLLQDAGKLDVGCVRSRGPIMLCGGTVISKEYVQSQMGFDGGVCFCVGRGVTIENGTVRVDSATKSSVRICRYGNKAYVCINSIIACETKRGCHCV